MWYYCSVQLATQNLEALANILFAKRSFIAVLRTDSNCLSSEEHQHRLTHQCSLCEKFLRTHEVKHHGDMGNGAFYDLDGGPRHLWLKWVGYLWQNELLSHLERCSKKLVFRGVPFPVIAWELPTCGLLATILGSGVIWYELGGWAKHSCCHLVCRVQ